MRNIVVTEELSLDGVMEYPAWNVPYWDDDIAKFKSEESYASDALLMGRVTYQELGAAWADSTEDGADQMNNLPKYVASTTLNTVTWKNSQLIKGNVVDELIKLKQQPGKDILVYGSGKLVQTLMQHNLVDVYRLLIYPVVVGKGKRLFKEGTPATLTLVESQAYSSGVVALVYHPEKQA